MRQWFARTAKRFQERAGLSRNLTAGEHQDGVQLKKCLNYFDLTLMGLGAMVGAGVFVLTGECASEDAGPAVMISFLISSFVAAVTALCYSEFAVDLPLAGSAFNYISHVFGEFLAWVAAIEMVMEYTLSAAAVAKGCSGYFATLVGQKSDWLVWLFWKDRIVLDPVALVVVVGLCIVVIFGIRESSTFNIIVTGINLGVVLFILGMSAPKIDTANYTPFIPPDRGVTGVFAAASVLFFAYVGFDALATVAEEVKKPSRDIPVGMLTSLALTTVLYAAMGAAITGMLPYKLIDVRAPFAVVFSDKGLDWVSYIVSLGAVTGTLTAALAMLVGQARIYMVLARQSLVPTGLARVHPKFQTPLNAALLTMVTVGIPAFVLDLKVLANMVSMGTLTTMAMVCTGILFRTYHKKGGKEAVWPLVVRLVIVIIASIVEGLVFAYEVHYSAQIVAAGIWLIATLSFYFLPVVYRSKNFNVPLKPIIPCLGILASIHLICGLGKAAFIRFGVWQGIGLLWYFLFSLQQDKPLLVAGTEPLLS